MTRPKATFTITATNDNARPFRVREIATGGMLDFASLAIAEAWIKAKIEGGLSYDQRGNRMGAAIETD